MEENKTNMIIVDDGYEKVQIKNKCGEEVGVFYFNPTDMGIIKRFDEVANKFATIVEPLKEININPDGTSDTAENVAKLGECEERLYELCNYLFGGDMAESFFGKINPFSPVNGKFYCENALNAVSQYISDKFNEEVKKINTRVEKYTHGVKFGKHSGGRK